MIQPKPEDEMLMALADGELAPAEAAALRSRIASDTFLAARFATFVETRALIRAAADAQADDRAAVPGSPLGAKTAPPRPTVTHLGRAAAASGAGRHSGRRALRWALPLAASVLLGLGALGGYLAADRGAGGAPAMAALLGAPAAETALGDALQTLPSHRQRPWSDRAAGVSGHVVVIATHTLGDGTPCREFEVAYEGRRSGAVVGASCRRDGRWQTEIVAAKPKPGSGYSPASGASAVDQYLTSLGSSGALSQGDEAALLKRGW